MTVFKDSLMVARQKGCIITTLEPESQPSVIVEPKKSIAPQLRDISAALAKFRQGSPLQRSALALARLSIELALAEENGELTPLELATQARKISRAARRLLDVLDIMEEE